MLDEKLERCAQIIESVEAIEEYMQSIGSPEDFLNPKTGRLYLDATTMRLQVIGENAKQIEHLHPSFFWTELGYDVGYIVRFRDFVSHHYEKLDYEVIYELCVGKLPKFKASLQRYLTSL